LEDGAAAAGAAETHLRDKDHGRQEADEARAGSAPPRLGLPDRAGIAGDAGRAHVQDAPPDGVRPIPSLRAAGLEAEMERRNGSTKLTAKETPSVPPTHTAAWDPNQRRRWLRRLSEEVQQVRASLAEVSRETTLLLEVSQSRSLSAGEQARERYLRRESLRLRYEMKRLWQEFEIIRADTIRRHSH
jgi:hypothetical protein